MEKTVDMLEVLGRKQPKYFREAFPEITEEEWKQAEEEIWEEYSNPLEVIIKFDPVKVCSAVDLADTYSEAVAFLLLKSDKRYATPRDIVEALTAVQAAKKARDLVCRILPFP
jgi:hypothetical protein